MPNDSDGPDDLADALATELAAVVRRAMHDHNDFALAEAVVEKLGTRLGVRLVVGVPGWYDVENITRLGQGFVQAVDWALRWPGRGPDVTAAVGEVLHELHDRLSDSRGTSKVTRGRTQRPSLSRTPRPKLSTPTSR